MQNTLNKIWWTIVWKQSYADIENGFVDTVGEGKSGVNGESSIDIYTLLHVKYITGENLLYNTGSPAGGSVMT